MAVSSDHIKHCRSTEFCIATEATALKGKSVLPFEFIIVLVLVLVSFIPIPFPHPQKPVGEQWRVPI
jgi:hypothetical protein